MKPKKAIKELRKQLKGEPGNVVIKIRLASLLRDVNEYGEAVQLYLAVAQSYMATERLGQAIAVCKGILEFAPQDPGAHQMLAYLEQSRLQSELEESQAKGPALPRYSSPPPNDRRKRPTSFPTPLSDGGPSSPLPGAPPTPGGVAGRPQRLQRPSEPPLSHGLQRNARPTETMGHTLSLSPREPDATVPGAPPTRPTNEFKLRDLSAAGAARIGDAAEHDDGLTQRKIPKLSTAPRLPLPRTTTISAGPPPPPPAAQRRPDTGAHTVARGRRLKPSYEPPMLAPAPTPAPREMQSPPPPPLHGRDEPSDDTDEPGLEDATIVDANFDMAKFILSQSQEEHDPSDADLPEIPGLRKTESPRYHGEEVTRIADPEPEGVEVDQLGALRRLPDYALKALAAGARENTYPAGYTVLGEGDANDTCYLLLAGGLRVLKRNPMHPGAPLAEAARLVPGALFGEYAMVGDRRCMASVQTSMASTVIEIPRASIADLTSRFPGLRPSLELLYRDILIESLMSSSSVFRVLTQEEWPEVLGLFEPVRATRGQSIVKAGERFGGFYLVLTGELSVHSPQGAVIRGLGAGFYLGEVSMLRGELARATVTAESTVELARLDARRFYALVASNARLWAHIWQEVQRPELVDLQLVAGVAANI